MFNPDATLTVVNAKNVLESGLRAIGEGQCVFDLQQIKVVDSAAVATMLAWQRAAKARGTTLRFDHLPDNLKTLVELYDVAELLSLNVSERH